MKKAIKIVAAILIVIIALMIILPFTMKGKIQQLVKMEANTLLNARLNFEDLSISLFRNFPDATVSVKGVSIIGLAPFEGDTLMAVQHIRATVNIMSLFDNDGFHISEVLLERPLIQGLVDSTGNANWDIVKTTLQNDPVTPVAADESVVKLKLKEFRIDDAEIRYFDCPEKLNVDLQHLNVRLSGDLDSDRTQLKSLTEVGSIRLSMDDITYLKEAAVSAEMNIDADFKQNKFLFEENKVSINAIETSLDGWIAFPDTTQMDMDLKLNTSKIGFKEILSLIPAVYQNDFKNLKADGKVQLGLWAKGILKKDHLPAFATQLMVENGSFGYHSLPESISDIQIHLDVNSQGGALDNVKVALNRFHFVLAGNPFDLTASATHLSTDLQFAMNAMGKIDLDKLSDVYPLGDSIRLNGLITSDLAIAGNMSQIEKQQYDQLPAKGSLELQQMKLIRNAQAPLEIRTAKLLFTPRFVDLAAFEAWFGKNNLRLSGKLENFIPYALKGDLLKGSLQAESDYVCINDFMTSTDAVEVNSQSAEMPPASSDSVASEILLIPENIDFNATVLLKEVILDKLRLTDVKGQMQLAKATASLNGLSLRAFDGTMQVSGKYNTADKKHPTADMRLGVKDASFGQTFESIESLQKLAPIFEKMTGTYSMDMVFRSQILPGMTPDLNTVNATGSIRSKEVRISGVEALDKLSDALKYEPLRDIAPKDMNLNFEITNGQITVKPFQLKMGETVMTLGGTTGLDQQIDYRGTVSLPADGIKAFGMKIKNLPFSITGTYQSPKIALDTKALASAVTADVVGSVAGKLGIDTSKFNSDTIAAKKEKAIIKARELADKLIKEANLKAEQLIEKAGDNPIKKIAAKKAADALLKEAQKKADELITNAAQ